MRKNILFLVIGLLAPTVFLAVNFFRIQNFRAKKTTGVNEKILILHADDLGISHSANQAFISVVNAGRIRSGSIMAVTDAFGEIADFARNHAELDFGVHLVLTSEWPNAKWKPVLPVHQVPSLVDDSGYFYATCRELIEHAKHSDVKREIEAQIEKTLNAGVRISHIDTHMGCLMQDDDLFEIYLKIARRKKIHARSAYNYLGRQLRKKILPQDFILDSLIVPSNDVPLKELNNFYQSRLQDLPGGYHLLYLHPSYDDAESRAIYGTHIAYGAQWRAADLNFLLSEELPDIIRQNGIELRTWTTIKGIDPNP